MTRKDYVKFAAMLKDERSWGDLDGKTQDEIIDDVSISMADILAADNPNFDRARFLAACGVES